MAVVGFSHRPGFRHERPTTGRIKHHAEFAERTSYTEGQRKPELDAPSKGNSSPGCAGAHKPRNCSTACDQRQDRRGTPVQFDATPESAKRGSTPASGPAPAPLTQKLCLTIAVSEFLQVPTAG